jgi:Ca2+-binding RTX toxin-like protein
LRLEGGAGNDYDQRRQRRRQYFGGDGNDFADGNAGADSASLGAGDDVFRWDSGDGGDTIDGEAGIDRIDLNGSNAAEVIFLSPISGRILLSPDFGAPSLDLDNLERIAIAAAGGADSINIGDLAGTDVQLITLNLAGTIGGTSSDGAIDVIGLEGTSSADNLTIAAAASSLSVTGLSYSLVVNQADPTLDGMNFHGQAGNDTISAAGLATAILQLVLGGDAGDDTITGSAVADQLFGGADNDVLVGGAGGDAMFGESGNDLMIWNAGDGDDVLDGGAGTGDVAQVRASDAGELLSVGNTATTVNVGSPGGGFSLDILATEFLLLEGRGGNDFIQANGALAGLILVTLDGGAGNDNIVGGNGGDTILGGDGDDFVQDAWATITPCWAPATISSCGSPVTAATLSRVKASVDALQFDGAAAGEVFNITSSAGRIAVQRDIGSATVTLDAVEQLVVNAAAGSDTIFVTDLAGGGATAVTLNLAQTIGGSTPDLEVDNVVVSGGSANETVTISGASGLASITGLPASISINQLDSHDNLNVAGGGGNDTISASGVFLTLQSLVLDGNGRRRHLVGSAFKDALFGGTGNDIVQSNGGSDTISLGDGDDLFIWNSVDDDDLVTGDAGQDTLRFNSSDGGETIVVQPSVIPTGMGALVVRGAGTDVVSTDLIETIQINAFGGEDIINIFNLTGTDVTRVVVDLGFRQWRPRRPRRHDQPDRDQRRGRDQHHVHGRRYRHRHRTRRGRGDPQFRKHRPAGHQRTRRRRCHRRHRRRPPAHHYRRPPATTRSRVASAPTSS